MIVGEYAFDRVAQDVYEAHVRVGGLHALRNVPRAAALSDGVMGGAITEPALTLIALQHAFVQQFVQRGDGLPGCVPECTSALFTQEQAGLLDRAGHENVRMHLQVLMQAGGAGLLSAHDDEIGAGGQIVHLMRGGVGTKNQHATGVVAHRFAGVEGLVGLCQTMCTELL